MDVSKVNIISWLYPTPTTHTPVPNVFEYSQMHPDAFFIEYTANETLVITSLKPYHSSEAFMSHSRVTIDKKEVDCLFLLSTMPYT